MIRPSATPSDAPNTWAVIVSWNVGSMLRQGLISLHQAAPRPGIVVVDNASTDGTPERVRREFPDVLLEANATNRGFAAATNQGIRIALARGATRILLLNPDAEIPSESLAILERILDARPAPGMIAPALRNADGTPQAFAFGDDPSLAYLLRRGARRLLRRPPLHDWGSTHVVKPDWVTAACVLSRAELFHRGLWFEEAFFLYFEDNDWCRRVRRAGWAIEREPSVAAIHHGGCSLKRNPAARDAYARSLRLFYRLHYPRWHGWVLRLLWPLYARLVSW